MTYKWWLSRIYVSLEDGNHPKYGCSKLKMSREFEIRMSETTDEPPSRVAAKSESEGKSSGKNGGKVIPSPSDGSDYIY